LNYGGKLLTANHLGMAR